MSPTLQATLIEALQVLISLLCAYLLLTVLKGTAVIKRKGVQLGGSAAVFVTVLVLLNRYLPAIQHGLIVEAAAAQPVVVGQHEQQQIIKISVSPAAQIVTKRELDALDRNQFIIDEQLGVAIAKPPGAGWESGRFSSIETVALTDVPTIGFGSGMMQGMFGATDAVSKFIFGVRRNASTLVEIAPTSSIQSVPASFNMFDDDAAVRKMMVSQVTMMKKLQAIPIPDDANIDDLVDEIVKTGGPLMKKKFSDAISSSFPIKKTVKSGVYVSIIPNDIFSGSIMSKFTEKSSVLDKALLYESLIGNFATTGGLRNLYVDQLSGLVSFNSSIDLADVIINSKSTDIKLNHVDFIISAQTRAVAVDLLYVSNDGIDIFEQLKTLLDSLRVSG